MVRWLILAVSFYRSSHLSGSMCLYALIAKNFLAGLSFYYFYMWIVSILAIWASCILLVMQYTLPDMHTGSRVMCRIIRAAQWAGAEILSCASLCLYAGL